MLFDKAESKVKLDVSKLIVQDITYSTLLNKILISNIILFSKISKISHIIISINFLNVLTFLLYSSINQLLDDGTISHAEQSPVLVEQVRFQRVVYRGNSIKDDRAVPG